MKKAGLLSLFIAFLTNANLLAQAELAPPAKKIGFEESKLGLPTLQSSPEVEKVRTLITQWIRYWNHHDADMLSDLCEPNADVIDPKGKWAHGKERIRSLLTLTLKGAYAKSELDLDITSIRFITPDLALIDTDGSIHQIQTAPHEFSSSDRHIVFIALKQHGSWKISAVRPYRLLYKLSIVE